MFLVHDIPFWRTFTGGFAVSVQYPTCFYVRFVIKLENIRHHPGDIQADIIELDFIIQFIAFGKITDNETADMVYFLSADFHSEYVGN